MDIVFSRNLSTQKGRGMDRTGRGSEPLPRHVGSTRTSSSSARLIVTDRGGSSDPSLCLTEAQDHPPDVDSLGSPISLQSDWRSYGRKGLHFPLRARSQPDTSTIPVPTHPGNSAWTSSPSAHVQLDPSHRSLAVVPLASIQNDHTNVPRLQATALPSIEPQTLATGTSYPLPIPKSPRDGQNMKMVGQCDSPNPARSVRSILPGLNTPAGHVIQSLNNKISHPTPMFRTEDRKSTPECDEQHVSRINREPSTSPLSGLPLSQLPRPTQIKAPNSTETVFRHGSMSTKLPVLPARPAHLPVSHLDYQTRATNDISHSETAFKSFLKRPIRPKKDKKVPPPPLLSISPVNTSYSPSRRYQKPQTEDENSVGSPTDLAGPSWGRKTLKKTKSNPLLAAAAKSIVTGDSKLFQAVKSLKPPWASNNNPLRTKNSNNILKPWTTNNVPLSPRSPRRVPVPAYDLNRIYATADQSSSLMLNRTASHDRHRHVRPGTGDSKHSRSSSLPYHHFIKLTPSLNAFEPPRIPSVCVQVENDYTPVDKASFNPLPSKRTSHSEMRILKNDDGDQAEVVKDKGKYQNTRSELVRSPGSSARDSKQTRQSGLSYDEFHDLFSKTLAISTAEGYNTVENSLTSSNLDTSHTTQTSSEDQHATKRGSQGSIASLKSKLRTSMFGGKLDHLYRRSTEGPSDLESSFDMSFCSSFDGRNSSKDAYVTSSEMQHLPSLPCSTVVSPLERVMDPIGLIRSLSHSNASTIVNRPNPQNHGAGERPRSIAYLPSLENTDNAVPSGTLRRSSMMMTPPITSPLNHSPSMEAEIVGRKDQVNRFSGFPFPRMPVTQTADVLNHISKTSDLSLDFQSSTELTPQVENRAPESPNANPSRRVSQLSRQMSILLEVSDEDLKSPDASLSRPDRNFAQIEKEIGVEIIQLLEDNSLLVNSRREGDIEHSDDHAEHVPKSQISPAEEKKDNPDVDLNIRAVESLRNSSVTNEESNPSAVVNVGQRCCSPDQTTMGELIGSDTSIELAADILGHLIPEISKSMWKRFVQLKLERQVSVASKVNIKESAGSAVLDETGWAERATPKISCDVGVQTDYPEGITPAYYDFVFDSSPIPQKINVIEASLQGEMPSSDLNQTTKIHSSRTVVQVPPNSSESANDDVPEFESGESFVSVSDGKRQDLEVDEDIQEFLCEGACTTSPELFRSSNINRRRSENGRRNPDFLGHHPVRSVSSLQSYHVPTYSNYHGISQLRDAILVDRNVSLLNQTLDQPSSSNSSPIFAETVIQALDAALKAEEGFQREKNHLQSVARRQSQTIEGLLVDKEVLSLEVTRLTGLVELMARDHSELNERIDQAEAASASLSSTKNMPGTCLSDMDYRGYRRGGSVKSRDSTGPYTPVVDRQRSDSVPIPRRSVYSSTLLKSHSNIFGSDGDEERLGSMEEDDDSKYKIQSHWASRTGHGHSTPLPSLSIPHSPVSLVGSLPPLVPSSPIPGSYPGIHL